MSNLLNTYTNAILADATYALVGDLQNVSSTFLTNALGDRMTPTLAKYIGDNFTVVNHIDTNDGFGSGFDATVWRENATGKIFVSMRGTEGAQDFLTDADLALSGNARNQLVDMVNWWFKITAPAGQPARQIQLEPLYDNSTPPVLLRNQYSAAPDARGTGLVKAGDLAQGIEVNGHSLGGYLATAFTRLFGRQAHVEHTSTFNSAGFSNAAGLKRGMALIPEAMLRNDHLLLGGGSFPARYGAQAACGRAARPKHGRPCPRTDLPPPSHTRTYSRTRSLA